MWLIDADKFEELFENQISLGNDPYHAAMDALQDVTAFDAEPVRHGLGIDARDYCGAFVCSKCEYQSMSLYDYCPKCGAKMDGGADK